MTEQTTESTRSNATLNESNEWVSVHEAWNAFADKHPELGYKAGRWPLYNFLRHFRQEMTYRDAIRKAKGRHWIGHSTRFSDAAFDCATGLATQCTGSHRASCEQGA